VKASRSIPLSVQLQLVALSAGRCQFAGCNRYLFAHPLTQHGANFSEKAHIRPFSPLGPRGKGRSVKRVHAIENVMLVCPADHRLIDKNPMVYPVDVLRRYKEEHERRILELTDIGPELRTTVLHVKGTIGGQEVDIPAPEVRAAIAPRYPADRTGHVIDLSSFVRESPEFFRLAHENIRRHLRLILSGGIDGPKVQHFSVFALAPIPVLAAFGRELGDKVTADLYQRHRDPQSWKWKTNGEPVEYELRTVRQGSDSVAVGLILSISGEVTQASLPSHIDDRFTLYEIIPKGMKPNRELVRLREDLLRFRRAYQHALATILKNHNHVRELHLFPAVPAPVAVACGQELLPKVHPDLVVYDNVKGAFQPALTLNTGEEL